MISDPFLNDPYFGRSVVVLCEHNQDGTFGFVLNNYLDIDLHKIDSNFPNMKMPELVLVDPYLRIVCFSYTLFWVRGCEKLIENTLVGDDLYYGGDFDDVCRILENNPSLNDQIRFFIGYSGWDENQLDEELNEKTWITVNNIDKSLILDTDMKDLWHSRNCS